MDKSIYEKASAELILFNNSDVVVTSPGENSGSVGCGTNVFSAGNDDVRCDFGW